MDVIVQRKGHTRIEVSRDKDGTKHRRVAFYAPGDRMTCTESEAKVLGDRVEQAPAKRGRPAGSQTTGASSGQSGDGGGGGTS